jgi:hypothetical protein
MGADWYSSVTDPPPGWKPLAQLLRAGLASLDAQPSAPNKPTVRVARSRHAARPKRLREKRAKRKMPLVFGQLYRQENLSLNDRIGR